MRYPVLLLLVALFSCTGSLSDEQRKRIKESMEQGAIKKLSESQITDAAFQYGRKVTAFLEQRDNLLSNAGLLDSVSQAFNVEVISLQSDNQNLRGIEQQILEAYLSGNASTDNIQKIGTDSLLYTKPILRENPDGSTEFLKAIGIRMTRKQVVLSIND